MGLLRPFKAFTLAEVFSLHFKDSRRFAFTLAEVLITLGIIGIVTAMTLPALVGNYQKKVVETRIKKFYTNINQVIKLSEVENGALSYWEFPLDNDSDSMRLFYDKYLSKFIKTIKIDNGSQNNIDNEGNEIDQLYNYLIVYFSDGSSATMRPSGTNIDINFYPVAARMGNIKNRYADIFAFVLQKEGKSFVEPYTAQWDGTRENLINHPRYGCRRTSPTTNYCCKLLQLNNWQIKDDYPW